MNNDISELLEMPDPEDFGRTSTRTFSVERSGKTYAREITIRADGKADAAFYAQLLGLVSQLTIPDNLTDKLKLSSRFTATLPGANGEGIMRISVDSREYLLQLKMLEAVAVNPKWGRAEWALFGRKFGSDIMTQLDEWVQSENGVTEWLFGKMNDLKNAVSAESEALTADSSALSGDAQATFLNDSSKD